MANWGGFVFNEPYLGETINRINDVILPVQYINFMNKHNGGEGNIGETWLILFPLKDLQEINDDYCIEEFLPGHIVIGTNGNGELYGIDRNGDYFNVPEILEKEYISVLGNDIEKLPEKINELWKQ